MSSMKSTVKKLDDNVVKALTKVCEDAKLQLEGFDWLTHRADYSNFPASLAVTCVFLTEQQLRQALELNKDVYLRKQVQKHLLKAGILLKDVRRNVFLDSEEACAAGHNGNWDRRLAIQH